MTLMNHQKYAVERLHNGAILWGAVGSGKSRTALSYYMQNEYPKNFYVITTAKKRDSLDWEDEADQYGIEGMKVDSWNNIRKYEDVVDAFFVFDEQRVVGSGVWVRSFLKISKRNNWILLSATPGDTWLDYIPVFIANGYYRNRTEFLREHVVFSSWSKFPRVERYVNTARLHRLRREVLVEMPYEKHTRRHEIVVPVDHPQDLVDKIIKDRWNVFENRPFRNLPELFYCLRKAINIDPSRLDALRMLWEKHPKLIVFYNFDYELDIMRDLSNLAPVGEWNGHRHQAIPKAERWLYLVQYMSGSEGWNCTETDTMAFYSLTYSYRQFHQAQGRIDRMNSDFSDLSYVIFISKTTVDRQIWRAIRRKENFNERKMILG